MTRRTLLVGAAGWLALTAAGLATTDVRPFRFSRALTGPELSRDERLAVRLDAEVFAATRDDVRAVRLLDRDGKEVPFLFETQTAASVERRVEDCAARTVSFRELEENRFEIVVELLAESPVPDHVEVDTPQRDFERRVSIDGAAGAGGPWLSLASERPLCDYSRHLDFRLTRIDFAAGACRAFRVVVDNVTDSRSSAWMEVVRGRTGAGLTEETARTMLERRDFRISGLRFRHTGERRVEGQPREAESRPVRWEIRLDAKHKQTEILVTGRAEPWCGLTVEASSRNYSRPARVDYRPRLGAGEAGQADWRSLGQAVLQNVDFRGVRVNETTVRFPGTPAVDYRIVIEDGDSGPLTVTGVRAWTWVQRLVWLGYAGASYRLYYGSDTATVPTYDLKPVLDRLPADGPTLELGLGPEEANPGFRERADWLARLGTRTAFTVAVALLVVVLGWAVVGALRRVEAPLAGGPEPKGPAA